MIKGLGMWKDLVGSRAGCGEVRLHRALKTILGSLNFIIEALGNIFRSLNRGQECSLIVK